ncbi:MAG: 50S ribosomal protein L16 [Candidatus Chisholmbacteria bacterium RIFCSPHIGHO2_01_FULL_49_18]|uniref:Large ribosomal subunit protein uL16 n=2 Tax=Candidatus Chisholmiibacteriota TaxID=1817900 RepID=A0A1G1VLU6_9BACT|nr:MAG: 50S ribosomal protein L16 [Candidatus Chisholmbacteria bacterium RIFCSPHIGHO2_01_FULL_49_18]OGY19378.1 MAG: 50S ribosomal protein L16 [Candidatus Chisholmbacteria bacterium RIFCSPLOWO2_01_FULL_49_14]
MLQPKKRKYRKDFRGTRRGKSSNATNVDFGDFGIKSLGVGWVTARQIEAARRVLSHHTKRTGKVWIRIFPDKPITHKAAGSKMGSGKGDIEQYVAVVRPGRILFELGGVSETLAKDAFRVVGHKLPVRTKFVKRD